MAQVHYQQHISHAGLNKYRVVRAASRYELARKVNAITAQWDAQWQRLQARELRNASEQALRSQAEAITAAAEQEHLLMEQLLVNAISSAPLTFTAIRNAYKPSKEVPVLQLQELPAKPDPQDERYNPQAGLFTRLFNGSKHKEHCRQLYAEAVRQWEDDTQRITAENESLTRHHQELLDELTAEKQAYLLETDEFQTEFLNGSPSAMSRFVALLLEQIEYPFPFEHNIASYYTDADTPLVVDVFLPTLEDLPTLKQAAYVKTRNAISEKHFSASDMRKKYNALLYQTVLLMFHMLFDALPAQLVDTIVLNGHVSTIDKTNGQPIEPCILSVRTTRSDITGINLHQVDPVAWFKHTKGISASSFADVTPVAPIIALQTSDSRFVDGYSVTPQLDGSVNLASMDWLDFENLIREIFEQEFSNNGGEVRITQASRDGGVDAVAFDPDPIRGGKIVIQAKRYTNVVGVSAVRDLYGTMMNEGAMKGILVTTSTYGKDAYDFAAGKPLTLLSGSELLYLLEKHGHSARIDINEARMQRT